MPDLLFIFVPLSVGMIVGLGWLWLEYWIIKEKIIYLYVVDGLTYNKAGAPMGLKKLKKNEFTTRQQAQEAMTFPINQRRRWWQRPRRYIIPPVASECSSAILGAYNYYMGVVNRIGP